MDIDTQVDEALQQLEDDDLLDEMVEQAQKNTIPVRPVRPQQPELVKDLASHNFFGVFVSEKEFNTAWSHFVINIDEDNFPVNSCVALSTDFLSNIIHLGTNVYNKKGVDVDWGQKNDLLQWKELIPTIEEVDLKHNILFNEPVKNYDTFKESFKSSIILNILMPLLEKYPDKNHIMKKDTVYVIIPFGYNIVGGSGHQLSMIIDLNQLYMVYKSIEEHWQKTYTLHSGQTYIGEISNYEKFTTLYTIDMSLFNNMVRFIDNMTNSGESISNPPTELSTWIDMTFAESVEKANQANREFVVIIDVITFSTPLSECATQVIVGGKKNKKKKNTTKKKKKTTKKKKKTTKKKKK